MDFKNHKKATIEYTTSMEQANAFAEKSKDADFLNAVVAVGTTLKDFTRPGCSWVLVARTSDNIPMCACGGSVRDLAESMPVFGTIIAKAQKELMGMLLEKARGSDSKD